ncbi:MAG: hypothetical protein IT355_09505 [Gemmatimonadaceae bacterium]|nr:hypothetical protein [Gemmatimonadaceae bacterium]
MTDPTPPAPLPPLSDEDRTNRRYRNVGVGCFTTFIGFFGGGMIAVLLSKIVAQYLREPQCEGLPTCNWLTWAARGGVVGMIILPTISVWRLKRGDAAHDRSRSI